MKLIDLHLHLDGSLSPETTEKLCALQGAPFSEALKRKLSCPKDCRDLNEYLACFSLPCSLLQTGEALSFAAESLCRELGEEGHCYAEIRFAPQKHTEKGLSQGQAVEAVLQGMKKSAFPARLILCCMRGEGNEKDNFETLETAAAFLQKGVCAVDLAGAEALYPTENFSGLFTKARALGLPFTIHAGEAAGAESIRYAVEFGARRIGHGVRAVEDASLCALLAERKIPLELCPTSNLNTRVFHEIREFPLRKLLSRGVPVTINSDNRTVSATNVREELLLLKRAFSLSEAEIHALLLSAVSAAFLGEREKQVLRSKMEI